MASPSERSSGSRGSNPLMPGRIVIAFDATKNHSSQEFKKIITNIQMRDGMIQEADTITVLGVLHKVLHPMGFQMQIGPDAFIGTRIRAIKEDVSRMIDAYVRKLQHSAEECLGSGVIIEVKIVVGAPMNKAVVQEAIASNATWVVLNRYLRKESRFYLKHIPCKVALVLDDSSLEVLRPFYSDKATGSVEHKPFYSLSKRVPLLPDDYNEKNEQSVISPSCHGSMSSQETPASDKSSLTSLVTSKSEQSFFSPDEFGSNPQLEKSDTNTEMEQESDDSYAMMKKQTNLQLDYDSPVAFDEMKMGVHSKAYSYSEIKSATNDFSSDNLLREGEYEVVYRGQLENGQLITVKVQKEANAQDFSEFHSEVCVLTLICHKNVVMLLGYSRKENVNFLVYEYICNKSLEWHLFGHVLEWHRRHTIAIGIAKGLRFLHEECRGSPIIHQDIRLSNVFLTHEFVPMMVDCGLAKWKANRRTNLGTLEYLAPEYAENGTCSLETDIYAFGIVLIQLISGRKTVDSVTDQHQSLRQWAVLLIQTLSLDELVDPRLGDSYSIYELYRMAKAAYLCTQTKPAWRPTAGEVLRHLEGKNDHLHHLTQQYIPQLSNAQRPFLLRLPWFDQGSTRHEMIPPDINPFDEIGIREELESLDH